MFVAVHADTHAEIGKTKRKKSNLPIWASPHAGPNGWLCWEWEYECGCLRHPTASRFNLCAAHADVHRKTPPPNKEF
jgi:hypothetical protein